MTLKLLLIVKASILGLQNAVPGTRISLWFLCGGEFGHVQV